MQSCTRSGPRQNLDAQPECYRIKVQGALQGQRAPLRRSEQDARNDIDESPPTKPTSLYPEGIYAPVYEPKTPQANGQPLMYPGVTHDWETVDGKEFNQVRSPSWKHRIPHCLCLELVEGGAE